jgi:hypothetical protein
MPYDQALASRIRALLGPLPHLEEKKMFGGVGFLVNARMFCGVHKDSLIVRVGYDHYASSLALPFCKPFDITGRPMSGWVMVEPPGYTSDSDLGDWVRQGLDFARTLPAKES